MKYIDEREENCSLSMQRDILMGKPSELFFQNGVVVRRGADLGVPTPTHTFIYSSLVPLEKRARGLVPFKDHFWLHI